MAAKTQVMVSLEQTDIDRVDALRLVMGESRSRVLTRALLNKPGGILTLEAANVERLARLTKLARDAGMTWNAYVQKYAELMKYQTYPTTLEELEEKGLPAAPPAKAG